MTEFEKNQAMDRFAYYWAGYPGVPVPDQDSSGGGDYATDEEVQQAIQTALDSIYLERVDDDTIKLVVGDRELDPDSGEAGDKTNVIDDVYLTDVYTQENEEGDNIVHFVRNNEKPAITIDVADLDPVLDMEMF